MSDVIQLKDTCNWFMGEGILKSLTSNYDVPWKTAISDGQSLDDDYYGNHSGDKPISPLTEKLLGTNNLLDSTATSRLAGVIYRKYSINWDRAWLALQKEYDPLNNYDMHEVETPAETTLTITPAETTTTTKVPETTTTITPAETKVTSKIAETNRTIKTPETTTTTKVAETTTTSKATETTTSIKTPETTTKITPSLVKNTTEDFINGFNSDTASPSNKRVVTPQLISGGTGEEKVTQGTNAGEQKLTQGVNPGEEKLEQGTNPGEEKVEQGVHAGEDNITQGTNPGEESLEVIDDGIERVEQGTNAGEEKITVDSAASHVNTTQNDRELTRKGNIGVTTTQKLLTDEMDFRMLYNFFDSIVYPHLDKVLCMGYYKDVKSGLY